MSRWAQFVALGLGQLGGLQSLRDIVGNLRAQPHKLYHLVAGQQATAFENNILPEVGTTQDHTIYGLKADTTYMIRLRAQNRKQAYGPWSEYLNAATRAVAMTPPPEPSPAVSKMAEPMVEAGDMMLMVSWTEPASEKSITHYQINYKTATATTWMDTPVNVTAKEYTIDGLINGTAYLVRVRAVDSAGNMGEWSDNGQWDPDGG